MANLEEREKQVLELRGKGYSYGEISKKLNMNKSTVAYYIRRRTNQDRVNKKQAQLEYEQIVCENAAKVKSMNELCVLMNKRPTNTVYEHFKKIMSKHGLNGSHFASDSVSVPKSRKLSFEEKFSLREGYIGSNTKLKEELINLGIKEHKCEMCGNTHWNNQLIPLQLHHINGNRCDNRIENLQLLCPNCHAQTDNYAGKNMRNKQRKLYKCQYCGKEFHQGEGSSKTSTQYCSVECKLNTSGIKIPSREFLIQLFKELKSFTAVGKMFNVSDNAVRKWCDKNNLPRTRKEMQNLLK